MNEQISPSRALWEQYCAASFRAMLERSTFWERLEARNRPPCSFDHALHSGGEEE